MHSADCAIDVIRLRHIYVVCTMYVSTLLAHGSAFDWHAII